MTPVIFVHGWGFEPTLWNDVITRLEGIEPLCIDLANPPASLPDNAIAVGHSLGSLWLLKQNKPFKGFVSINGFDCFHEHGDTRATKAMQRNLRNNPEQQLRDFYTACGVSDYPGLYKDWLHDGLKWLLTWDGQNQLECLTMALAARDDLIVSPDMSTAIWDRTELHWTDLGGHVLPLTKPDWCVDKLQEFIHDLS